MLSKHSISAVIITKNEADTLPKCLESIKWVNEIIILDFNSNDGTRNIAAKSGAKIFKTNEWLGFGKQRQLAQKFATGDYILSIDADERINKILQQEITSILICPKKTLFILALDITFFSERLCIIPNCFQTKK